MPNRPFASIYQCVVCGAKLKTSIEDTSAIVFVEPCPACLETAVNEAHREMEQHIYYRDKQDS